MAAKLTPRENGSTQYRGILIDHEGPELNGSDECQQVSIARTLGRNKSASLGFALETGEWSSDDSPLTPKELRIIEEIEAAYIKAGLY